MKIQEQAVASPSGERLDTGQDPGDAWGSRSDGGIAPAFDYMDEDLEEAMIAIGSPVAMGEPPIAPAGPVGRD